MFIVKNRMIHFICDFNQKFIFPSFSKSGEARGNLNTWFVLIFRESRSDYQVTLVEVCLFEPLQGRNTKSYHFSFFRHKDKAGHCDCFDD